MLSTSVSFAFRLPAPEAGNVFATSSSVDAESFTASGGSLTALTVIVTVAVSQRLSPAVAALPSWPGSQSE